jgi:hypothetical protein
MKHGKFYKGKDLAKRRNRNYHMKAEGSHGWHRKGKGVHSTPKEHRIRHR